MIKVIWRKKDFDELSIYFKTHHNIVVVKDDEIIDHDHVGVLIEASEFERIKPIIRLITKDVSRMLFETKGGWVQQNVYDVMYIEAFGDEIYMHFENQKPIILSTPLYQLEEQLKPFDFIRISKSYIVHIRYILYIRTTLYGKLDLELTTGVHLDVTRSFVKSFKDALGIFKKEETK
ncbi:MAG: LytR/AlgR family response regulator transcription factor [Acholeplasmataceae bacterium]